MATPRLEINLEKIGHNAKFLNELYGSKGIDVAGVTKVVCGNPDIAQVLINNGIKILADSRISNIIKMRKAGIQAQFLLLRTPIPSQAEDVLKYTDISLNSELSVIKKLSSFAVSKNVKHKIILMVELGDLREGVMPTELDDFVKNVLVLEGIEMVGIGTNLACFGGIKPDEEKMQNLSSIVADIEKKFGLKLEIISGGNSANYNWFISTKDTGRINNFRLGESIFLGCETLNRQPIPGLFTDVFTLVAEVIESKIKPSVPYGSVSQDAFGNIPVFHDNGQIKRAILGIGLQDVLVSGITPRTDIDILGASSDHIIVDAKQTNLEPGDEVEFDLNYGALLSSMTSPYVTKNTGDFMTAKEYCQKIDEKYLLLQKLRPNILIRENNSPLVSLKNSGFNLVFEPSVIKDYKFLVREAVFDKIGRISKILDKEDKTLIIRSAWRSFEHQRLLWDNKVVFLQKKYPDKQLSEIKKIVSDFIAPESKSMHATGGAVDALIFDQKNNCVMDFGTNDGLKLDLTEKCYPYHPDIMPEARKNRKLLIDLFEKEDFVCDLKEYWHFDYGNETWAVDKGQKHSIYDAVRA